MHIDDIKDTDADYLANLATVKPSYTIDKLLEAAPIGKTAIYAEINAGRLIASSYGERRFVTGPNFAKWLTLLARESELVDRSHIRETNRQRARDWRARQRAEAESNDAQEPPPRRRGRPRTEKTPSADSKHPAEPEPTS